MLPQTVANVNLTLKANTLLADHLFSPSLLLAERIERGLVPLAGTAGMYEGCELAVVQATHAYIAQ